jgi:hypothetical protein
METFKDSYGRMMAKFRYMPKAQADDGDGDDPNDPDDPAPLIQTMEQIEVMINLCLGTSPTAPICQRHFYKKIGMAKVTGVLFVLNTNSVVKGPGFDTTNRIETLEDQMKVLHAQVVAGVVRNDGSGSGDSSDSSNDDPPLPPKQQPKSPLKTDPNKRKVEDTGNMIPEGKRENFL